MTLHPANRAGLERTREQLEQPLARERERGEGAVRSAASDVFVIKEDEEMLAHLREHLVAGHRVPNRAFGRLST